MTDGRFDVQHRDDEQRYVLLDRAPEGGEPVVIGEEQYVDVVNDGTIERVMFHTVVAPEYGGQGLASVLVRRAIEHSIAAGATVVPVCPYVAKWLEKHDEFAEQVVTPTPAHLEAISATQ